MKYLPILLLLLALCGCRHRRYVEEDEQPWTDTEVEQPVSKPASEVERLVEQARNEIQNRRFDDARVTLWQAFRRDRWHPAANVVYQDLMVERGRLDLVWTEYKDLYQANKQRGDALWFHLRPLIMKKTPVTLERGPKLGDDKREILDAALREARKLADDGKRAEAQTAVIEAFNIDADNVVGHRIAQDLWPEDKLPSLVKLYTEMSEDDPQSGDRLYLAARARARQDIGAAIEMLRKGLILELPGVWLRVGMAELATSKAKGEPILLPGGNQQIQDFNRSLEGWEMLAREYALIARAADATNTGLIELEAGKGR